MSTMPTIRDLIESSVLGCYPDDWNEENFITRSWLKSLRDQYGRRPLTWLGGATAIFDCQKLSGKLEQNHGDIGFVVKISGAAGKHFTGFASLEAKRSYPDIPSDKYHQLDLVQLERQAAYSPFHRLLLYSHTAPIGYSTHALVLSAHLARLNASDDSKLEYSAIPLGTQVVRYLRGWDLDFSLKSVHGILSGDIRFNYLAQVHISMTPTLEPSLADLEVRAGIYRDMDGPDQDMDQGIHNKPKPLPPAPQSDGPSIGGFSR